MIKQIAGILFVSSLLLLFTGCPYSGYKFEQGQFPFEPVNFQEVNSEYDDYNSTAPFIESFRYLYFSSNRNSNGGEFDIVGENFRVYWDKDHGKLTVDQQYSSWENYDYTDSLFYRINTGSNEYGPYALTYYTYDQSASFFNEVLIYSNDEQGNLDLKFAWYRGAETYPQSHAGTYGGPEPISFLNTEANDAYLTFYGPYFYTIDYAYPQEITELLFCSDRDGNYDIYSTPMAADTSLLSFLLQDDPINVEPVQILNSDYQDKCPFAGNQYLIFASDRPGGYGGFDLYFSWREGDSWSEPMNFGDRINTEYNEYRPIALQYYEFMNDLMIFSSDRPGGKGGYDLYYVGIPMYPNYIL
jgi:hypothetical protein